MFVSILQRFGFKTSRQAGQPLQSRADQNTQSDTPSGDGGGIHPAAAVQRRQAVKAKPAKSVKAIKSAGKPATPAKKAVKASASKPVTKTAAKAPPKAMPKPATNPKSTVKTAAQPAVKKPVKSAVKAKPVAKSLPVKAPATAAAKPSSKATAKPVLRASSKIPVKDAAKVAVKPVAKPVVKAVAKPAIVVVSKKAASGVMPPAAAKPVVQPKAVLASNGLPPPAPLKPGRRSSSRALAHMPPPAPMVPTHAPDAAKASYSTMTERVIAPPPHVAAKKDPKLANNWKTKTAESLTDEEVKAMPDAEYMNDKQMAFFRFKLSILKQDIHNSAGATTEHLREDTAVVPDPADRATIEEEHALELRTRDRERKLLKKIEQSIARIDSGDYGYCDETGEPIGVGRLIARPTASLSLEAQQRRELKQKMFGD